MKIEFLQEMLEEFWKSNDLPGGFSIDRDKGEVIIRTDCMECPETGHLIQYDERLVPSKRK